MPAKETKIDLERRLGWGLVARGRAALALRRLLEATDEAAVERLHPAEAAFLAGEREEVVAPLVRPRQVPGIDEARRRVERSGARLLLPHDEEFPPLLRAVPDAPAVLFVRGRPLARRPVVGIVGARRASRAGLEATRRIAEGLARAGCVVVSGFARGVDTAGHRGALAGGGETWAVFGCGIDVCYPAENREFLEELLASGAALSDFPPGLEPRPETFPVRNRIIAGLSRVVVVVEAAARSGSLITARLAADYGRDVGAVPGNVTVPGTVGSNALLKDGAILVRDADDVLAELPEEDRVLLPSRLPAPADVRSDAGYAGDASLSKDAAAVLAALTDPEGHDVEELRRETGLPAPRLSAALVELELESLADALPGGLFVRRRAR